MSNIIEPQIIETKPSVFGDYIKNNSILSDTQLLLGQKRLIRPSVEPSKGEPYIFLKDFSFIYSTSDGSIGSNMVNYKKDQVVYPFPQPLANEKRMLEPSFKEALDKGILVPLKTVQQQAIMKEMTLYSGLTDKVFGKSKQGAGLDPQILRVGAYMIIGAIVGRYVAKNMKKSATLGMVLGSLAPLLALKLTMEYDKKNMPKQEPNKPKPQEQEVKYEPKKDCPNGTKKVQTMCIKAPCPETEVCA